MPKEAIRRAVIGLLVVFVAGVAVAAFGGDGTAAQATGWGLITLAGIGALAGAFYLIGRSEDLAREREKADQTLSNAASSNGTSETSDMRSSDTR